MSNQTIGNPSYPTNDQIAEAIRKGNITASRVEDRYGLACKKCFAKRDIYRSYTDCECREDMNAGMKLCSTCSIRFNRCSCCGKTIVTTKHVEKYKLQQAYLKGYSEGYSKALLISSGFMLTSTVLYILK